MEVMIILTRRGKEKLAFDNNDVQTLRKYRARSLNVSMPNRLQFTFCVMSYPGLYGDQNPFYEVTDYIFCPFHGNMIRNYNLK